MQYTLTIKQAVGAIAGFILLVSLSGLLTAQTTKKPAKGTITVSAISGEQVYRKQCAACHGVKGEGTKNYRKPLTGSRSVAELSAFISKSMPPGPRKCSAEDAKKAAAFIYDAFYSPIAQSRIKPARISLSRLTVRQFRNSIADLIGSFRDDAPRPDAKRGLRGEYYKTGRHNNNDRVLQRVDPEIHFDYKAGTPDPAQNDPYQFAMRWEGSALAPDTGEYEFIVHTEHAMQLWVNDLRTPLIDAMVKSGSDNEFRASIFLLGGRAYPIRLEFTKGVQGVDNLEKVKKNPPLKASISLEWRRPKQAVEVIPSRGLLPQQFPETFVTATPFPPDDRSMGYERGTSVNKAWDEATTSAAFETAAYVTAHLRELSGAGDGAPDRETKLRSFCRKFLERAFRRTVTPEVERAYIDRQFKGVSDPAMAVKRVILLALKSPRFLYREIGTEKPDAFDTASRLSFGLWDSLPDRELRNAAADGKLSTPEEIKHQAERMVSDPRASFKLREYLLQWLKVDQIPDIAKDAKLFPGFDESASSDLRTSLDLFLASVTGSERSDYRQLFLSDTVFLNGRLAKLYDTKIAPDAPFEPVALNPGERSGVLTQPYIMSCLAYLKTSSPIHRGVLITRNLLGRTLNPPPAAFVPLSADLHPNMTTRQRVSMQTKPDSCIGCHGIINPLGFTMEKFDAIGRLRTSENGQPVDCSGSYQSRSGKLVKFSGVSDLAHYLAESDESHAAFVEKLFQHMTKQPVRAYGPQAISTLQASFEKNDCSIRKLMVDIVTLAAAKN